MKSHRALNILIPGIAMKSSEFENLALDLDKRLPEFLCFENLCVGSGPRKRNPSIEDFADNQWQYLSQSGHPRNQRINIIGFSMGGMIAATMATQKPNLVQKLVLVSTALNTPDVPAVSDQLFRALIAVKTPDDLLQSLTIGFSPACLKERPEILRSYFEYRLANGNEQSPEDFLDQLLASKSFKGLEVYRRLKTLKIPTVHIFGTDDQLFGQSHVAQLKPFVDTQIGVPGLGHMLHLEAPGQLADSIISCLID